MPTTSVALASHLKTCRITATLFGGKGYQAGVGVNRPWSGANSIALRDNVIAFLRLE